MKTREKIGALLYVFLILCLMGVGYIYLHTNSYEEMVSEEYIMAEWKKPLERIEIQKVQQERDYCFVVYAAEPDYKNGLLILQKHPILPWRYRLVQGSLSSQSPHGTMVYVAPTGAHYMLVISGMVEDGSTWYTIEYQTASGKYYKETIPITSEPLCDVYFVGEYFSDLQIKYENERYGD